MTGQKETKRREGPNVADMDQDREPLDPVSRSDGVVVVPVENGREANNVPGSPNGCYGRCMPRFCAIFAFAVTFFVVKFIIRVIINLGRSMQEHQQTLHLPDVGVPVIKPPERDQLLLDILRKRNWAVNP
ncbi:uncharacterized protein LOC117647223 [Thrips palmi]|uniref:Uncharacterized protein LOC117647223 n=1 Tax=Thrips palmi TaxID=161013 RepID=A0A6P8ZPV4_THRPL|nr:uncharacterized protein LOC117647223 [Thrips palmi]